MDPIVLTFVITAVLGFIVFLWGVALTASYQHRGEKPTPGIVVLAAGGLAVILSFLILFLLG